MSYRVLYLWRSFFKKHSKALTFGFIALMFIACTSWWGYTCYKAKYNIDKRFSRQLSQIYNNIEQQGERFAFKGNTLTFWSDNTIPVDSSIVNDKYIVELKNGYYLHKAIFLDNYSTHYLYLIKRKYNISNNYVDNGFNSPFNLNENISIINTPTTYPITLNGKTIAYLEASVDCLSPSKEQYFILYIWLCVNIFLTVICLLSRIKIDIKKNSFKILLLSLLYIAFAFITFFVFSKNKNLSLKFYALHTDYQSIFSFVIVICTGFLVYYLSERILRLNYFTKYHIFKRLLVIFTICLIGGTIGEVSMFESQKEQVEQKAYSLMQQTKKDDFASLRTLLNGAAKDSVVHSFIKTKQYNKAEQYIDKYYLSLVQDAYHTGLLVFDNNDSMIVHPDNFPSRTIVYVYSRLSEAKKIDSLENFYVENEYFDNKAYLFCCPIEQGYLFFECAKKINSQNMNYSLLLENEPQTNQHFSYAKYVNNALVYSKGDREFALHKQPNLKGWVKKDNYYTYYLNDNQISFAVSCYLQLIYDLFAAVSLFFVVFICMAFTEYLIKNLPYLKNFSLNIKNSILLALLGSFIVSLIVIGFFSIRSIRNLNLKNNLDSLCQTTLSIRFEIENILQSKTSLTKDDILWLSNTFLTDINIFDTKGSLQITSQQDIFDKGFLLNKINNNAFEQLKHQDTYLIYRKENIAKSKFLASYCPIKNERGKIVAYLNIPFINQQKAMQDNINNMINNFCNMFLFWLNVAVVIFVFLTNLITKPIDIVKEKLSKVDLDKKNEKIKWKRNDEMGALVKSYNKMIDKIEDSSLLLKQQERESAWRELAKQVAHDIKNPLTPMKLSLQYLEQLHKQKPDLFDTKWQQIAPTLIAQIDAVSTVASELNNYSRPSVKKEKISLSNCIQTAINLYSARQDVQISFKPKEEFFVLGDSKLFIRIFNNLIKNAIQSFYNQDKGRIDVDIKPEQDKYIVSVKDNGCGIKTEDQSKIFSTHFTTKQDGGGIGLTIVKSILEAYNATISFKSKENIGTIFFITFDIYKPNK